MAPPPHTPDLNSEEGWSVNVKQHLRNAMAINISDLRAEIERGFTRLRWRPDLMRGLLLHAGLDVNQRW